VRAGLARALTSACLAAAPLKAPLRARASPLMPLDRRAGAAGTRMTLPYPE